MTRRALLGALAASVAALLAATPASAHPLGNYTVNRSVAVHIGAGEVAVRYVIDMAEIPAFGELQAIDQDGDGQADPAEAAGYAEQACARARSALTVRLDAGAVSLATESAPELSFPAGAGGLPTLRLVCTFSAQVPGGGGERVLQVTDAADDGHVGWREVTISGGSGVVVSFSDVPPRSPSAELTSYPLDALQTPPDVRGGMARFRLSGIASAEAPVGGPAAPPRRDTANDPLAALVGGTLTPVAAAGALLLALALGAGHAVSPGHGKTLVAAYLIGSGGSVRHAATLGLTVAVTHTAGVFLLGAATLLLGQFLVPERVIEWLALGSGVLVMLLGAGLVVRAAARIHSRSTHTHAHDNPGHDHQHHDGSRHPHTVAGHPPSELRRRNVVALGLAGGMVPSASALLVLLVAITTGRLVFGLLLIVAFGAGMALVLGGLAMATTLLRSAVRAPVAMRAHPVARVLARSVPLLSGIAVLVAGLGVTIGALTRFG